MGENICKIYSNQVGGDKIYKKLIEVNSKKTMTKIWTECLCKPISKEEIQVPNKYMKRCSTPKITSILIWKVPIQYHFIPVRNVKLPLLEGKTRDRMWRKRNSSSLQVGIWDVLAIMENTSWWRFIIKWKIELPIWSNNPTSGCIAKKVKSVRDICTPMFVSELFTITNISK